MRLILICTTAFLIFAGPVFSELTVQDLEKIRSIVKESEDLLKKDIENIRSIVKESEDLLKKDIENIRSVIKESEDGLKEHIDLKVSEMDKRLNMIFGFVVALISLIVIVVGIPQIIMVWRGRGERTQAEQIQELRQEIETLKQHIASH